MSNLDPEEMLVLSPHGGILFLPLDLHLIYELCEPKCGLSGTGQYEILGTHRIEQLFEDPLETLTPFKSKKPISATLRLASFITSVSAWIWTRSQSTWLRSIWSQRRG